MKKNQLESLLKTEPRPVLIHVLPEEVFEAKRIPGSLNACIYEVAFLENVARLVSDKSQPLVVYGAGGGSLDSRVAAETLLSAGYSAVQDFPGGLEEWEAEGGPLEGPGLGALAGEPADGRYAVDCSSSIVRWTGRNLFNHHSGTVRLAEGTLQISGGRMVSAAFRIDMSSIACEDIADPALNALLIQHLKAPDFFDVANFPTAEFEAQEAVPIPGSSLGTPNYELAGSLTLRAITRPVSFPIVVAFDGVRRITGQGLLTVDRTEFGSIYGSGKFFRFLGKHVVNDHVDLHVKIHAEPA